MIDPLEIPIVLGETADRSDKERHYCTMPMGDFMTHVAAAGTTGSGKTNLMANLALQIFIQGGTLVIIEPTENLLKDVIKRCPPALFHNITILDLASDYPPQIWLNDPRTDRSVAVQRFIEVIRTLDVAAFDGAPRTKMILRHCINLILDVDQTQASLTRLAAFLMRPELRIRYAKDASHAVQESKEYVEQLNSTEEAKPNANEALLAPSRTRVDEFMTNDYLRHSLALSPLNPDTCFDLYKALTTPQQLILLSFNETKLGPSVRQVLGALFIASVVGICKSRPKHYPTILMIDELMNIAGSGNIAPLLETILAETRQFQLGSMLMFQSFEQLSTSLQKAINSNANTKIALLQRHKDDAKLLANGFRDTPPDRIIQIQKYHAIIERMVNRQVQPARYVKTLAPLNYRHRTDPNPPTTSITPKLKIAIEALRPLQSFSTSEQRIQYLTQLSTDEFNYLVRCQTAVNYVQANHAYRLANTPIPYAELKENPSLAKEILQQLGCQVEHLTQSNPPKPADLIAERLLELARQISGRKYGFHRDWLEAHYRRTRFDATLLQKSPLQPAPRKEIHRDEI